MKLKTLFIACTITVALFASVYGIYTISRQNTELINSTLSKLEALAQNEGGGGRIECSARAICRNPGTGEERGDVTCYGYEGEDCTQGTEIDPSMPGVIWNYVQCGDRKYSCKDKVRL